jgi:CxxC motif-containing protein
MLTVLSISTEITSVDVNGLPAVRDGNDYCILAACGENTAIISVAADANAAIKINGVEQNPYTYTLANYGKNVVTVIVTVQNGNTETYTVTIDKPIPFDQIVQIRWNNTLTVINNPANNGGYTFTRHKWSRNGGKIGTDQSWSAGKDGEKQNAMMAQIPLTLQFQTGNKHRFYAAVGGKAGIPVNAKSKSSGATIQNYDYYADENYEYTTQEFMGFGTFTGRDTDDDLKFKTAFLASAEAGMKWKLKEGLSLYVGAYIDYGLNNICKEDNNSQLVAYNIANPKDFTVNSIMNSQYTQSGTAQPFTDKVFPMSAGLKVRLAFGKGSM